MALITPEGKIIEYALKFQFKATNNEIEYEAVIAGLQLCKALEAKRISLKTDSQLVVNQISGEFEAREENMQKHLQKTQELISEFEDVHVERLPRSQNEQADALSKLGSSSMQNLKRSVLVEVKSLSSIHENTTFVFYTGSGDVLDWMKDIIQYKESGELPADPIPTRMVKLKSTQFCMIDRELYKKAKNGLLLKCVTPSEADYILKEVHERCCGHHLGGRAVAHKAIIIGYYCPTTIEDAKTLVQRCEKCQKYAPNSSQPTSELKYIHNPIPFAQWGLDLLGPFK